MRIMLFTDCRLTAFSHLGQTFLTKEVYQQLNSRQALCRTPSGVVGFPSPEERQSIIPRQTLARPSAGEAGEAIYHTRRSVEEFETFGWGFEAETFHVGEDERYTLLTGISHHPPGPDIAATSKVWLEFMEKVWHKRGYPTHPSQRMKFKRHTKAKDEECYQLLWSMHELESVGELKTVRDQRNEVALDVVTAMSFY